MRARNKCWPWRPWKWEVRHERRHDKNLEGCKRNPHPRCGSPQLPQNRGGGGGRPGDRILSSWTLEALAAAPAGTAEPAALNAWMRIGTDDTVTIIIDKSEMGQGIQTALCMIAAEELECDWKKIRTEFAPAAKEYFNPAFGMQGTGGSSSVRSSWDPMRKAGAAARDMLVQAAAQKWGVEKTACRAA